MNKKGSRGNPLEPGATQPKQLLLQHLDGGLGLLGGHVRLPSLASSLGLVHESRGLLHGVGRARSRSGLPGRGLAARSLHILTARSLHILAARRLHVLATRSLHVLAARRLHVLTARSLHVLTARSLHLLSARRLHVLTARSLHIL